MAAIERHRREYGWQLALFLAGVLITLAGWSATVGLSAVDRSDVTEIVREQSPYVQDRGAIQLQLAQQTRALERLTVQVRHLELAVQRLEGKLAEAPR